MKLPGPVILQAIMGSHAYGMARPDSDIDRKGVYVGATIALTGLFPPPLTVTHTDPDYEYHELGKFCRLALKCNPTVLEQLYLDDYEVLTDLGKILVKNRTCFLSRKKVGGSFGGYAMDQIQRLQRRGDGSFSSDVRKRKEKHARHCFRLLDQGRELLETGHLTVKVRDPERLFEIGRLPDDELAAAFEAENARFNAAYEASSLPEAPNEDKVNEMLSIIRIHNL